MTILETVRLALFALAPTCILLGLRLWWDRRAWTAVRARRERQARQAAAEWQATYDEARSAYWIACLDAQARKYGQEV